MSQALHTSVALARRNPLLLMGRAWRSFPARDERTGIDLAVQLHGY